MVFLIIPTFFILNLFEPQIKISNCQINISAAPIKYTITEGYTYAWINASSGIELILGDDDSATTILPFNFSFYDGIYNEIYIKTEGYLSFTSKSVQTIGTIPSSHPHRQNIIAPYWTNLDGTSGRMYVKNFSTYWVVTWENFNLDNGSYLGTFESVLHKNGNIVFNYKVLKNVSVYACGLNYGDGNNYSSYNQLSSDINDFSIKFTRITASEYHGGNGGLDQNTINTIVGVVVPLGISIIIGGIILFLYRKNPEQFRTKLNSAKARFKKNTAKVTTKLKNGTVTLKEKVDKSVKKIKEKKPKKENK
ncbi:MAG: hypothetical protein ACFFG0_10140 [Candidatus Thorarchaeota archaeon]